MATPTTANLPTRQQLDEIDALLRRMLTLPPLAGESAAAPAPTPVPIPASQVYPPPVVREILPPVPPSPGDPVVHSWRAEWPQTLQPQTPAIAPSVVAWGSPVPQQMEHPPWAMASGPAGSPPPFAVPVSVGPIIQPILQPTNPSSGTRQTESLFVLSLVLLNGLFNLLTYLLGPLGTWVRGPGRGMLGWAGILMILAAAVWALGNWYGYDWPRPNLSRLGVSR
jgi:hypothetical protein